MPDASQPSIVKWPTDDEINEAFEIYALGVGKVAHSWNYLHEKLGQLFAAVTRAERGMILAVWYSTDNDRAQRKMLRAAVAASADDVWLTPRAKKGVAWLLDRAEAVSDQRNNAIHAPCSIYVGGGKGGGSEMGASFIHGHPRAKNLIGKRLIDEFEHCGRLAEALSRYAAQLETGIAFADKYPWPERPALPTRGGLGDGAGNNSAPKRR